MRRCRIESLAVSLPRRGGLLRWGAMKHVVHAGKACLKKSKYHPEDVQLIVNTGVHRDDHICEPAIAAYVQHRLGINVEFQGRRTLAFDLLNGGCGMLNAVHVVNSLMLAGDVQVGLVVSSEANSDRRPDPNYTYPPSGAALLLDLSPTSKTGFASFAFQVREEHAELFTSVVSLKQKHGRIEMQRRTAELEEAWLAAAGSVVAEVLEKDKLKPADVDLVIPAQISPVFLGRLPKAIGFAAGQVADLTGELPDTHSTSVFLAFERTVASGRMGRGKRALLLAFGSGITVGAATYQM